MQELNTILQLIPQAREYRREQISIGRSGSSVYGLANPSRPTRFLKVSTADDACDLEAERDRLAWLANRTFVPKVLEFGKAEGFAFLLTEALPGANAAEAPARLWSRLVEQVARQLRQLHSLHPDDCPFDRTLDRVILLAGQRAETGLVDDSDFDPEHTGRSAMELLTSLHHRRPQSEDIVVTHGDACLPNLIFENGNFSGFVDCRRCGRADRYQDLALAHRRIESNFGGSLAEDFLSAYGLEHVDSRRLSYYRLLDEFF